MSTLRHDVAVVIAAYNAADTIGRAVRSALAQTLSCDVVVVDDCSTDGTAGTARAADDGSGRLKVLRLPENRGPSAARNLGIAESHAPWVTPLDSDDFMEPQRIERLLGIAEAGAWDFLADDLWKVSGADPHGPRTRLLGEGMIEPRPLCLADFVTGNLRRRGGTRREFGFLKPLMRREFLMAHELRYAEDMRLGEDYDLYARALAAGARFCLEDPLGYVAVVRENSLSSRHRTLDLGRVVEADRRLLALPALDANGRRAIRRHLEETRQEWHWRRLIDAVNGRDWPKAAGCFAAPFGTVRYLSAKLAEQAWLRGSRRLAASLRR